MVENEAQRLGYFAKNGLKVTFVSVTTSAGPLQLLEGHQIDLADGIFSPDAMTAWAAGATDIRYVGGYLARNALLDTYAASKSINKPADLKGKTIAVGSEPNPSNPEYADFEALLKSAGLTDNDVHFAVTGTINQTVPALLAGRVDIAEIDLDDVPFVQADPKLQMVRMIPPGKYEAWGYTATALTRKDVLANKTKNTAIQLYMKTIIQLTRAYVASEPLTLASIEHLDPTVKGKSAAYKKTFWKALVGEWAQNGMMNLPSIQDYLTKGFYPLNPKSGKIPVKTFASPSIVKGILAQIGTKPTRYTYDVPHYTLP
jgi:hypothetical protein